MVRSGSLPDCSRASRPGRVGGAVPSEAVRARTAPSPTAAVLTPAVARASASEPGRAEGVRSAETVRAWSQVGDWGRPLTTQGPVVAFARDPDPRLSQPSAAQVRSPAVRVTRLTGDICDAGSTSLLARVPALEGSSAAATRCCQVRLLVPSRRTGRLAAWASWGPGPSGSPDVTVPTRVPALAASASPPACRPVPPAHGWCSTVLVRAPGPSACATGTPRTPTRPRTSRTGSVMVRTCRPIRSA